MLELRIYDININTLTMHSDKHFFSQGTSNTIVCSAFVQPLVLFTRPVIVKGKDTGLLSETFLQVMVGVG